MDSEGVDSGDRDSAGTGDGGRGDVGRSDGGDRDDTCGANESEQVGRGARGGTVAAGTGGGAGGGAGGAVGGGGRAGGGWAAAVRPGPSGASAGDDRRGRVRMAGPGREGVPRARDGGRDVTAPGEGGTPRRPAVTELRLSAFKSFRGARLKLGMLTVCAGASGTGKSNVLEALGVLSRLAAGVPVGAALGPVRGGPAGCVPFGAEPDEQGRRGIGLGCTVDGELGPVRLDIAVQVEPELRFVGERLTGAGEVLLETALRDPEGSSVQAAWHTAGRVPVTRAPLPDDRLASALLPLRVAGQTPGQRLVVSAVEQLVVGLRGLFPVDPEPPRMRGWAAADLNRLAPHAGNVSAVVARTRRECRVRHGLLGDALRSLLPYPVTGVTVLPGSANTVMAALERGALGPLPAELLGDGELRALALALVLLTGPGILAMDQAEVPDALQLLTVAAEDLDRGLSASQLRGLLELAQRMCVRGHVRVVTGVHTRAWVEGVEGVTVVPLPLR